MSVMEEEEGEEEEEEDDDDEDDGESCCWEDSEEEEEEEEEAFVDGFEAGDEDCDDESVDGLPVLLLLVLSLVSTVEFVPLLLTVCACVLEV